MLVGFGEYTKWIRNSFSRDLTSKDELVASLEQHIRVQVTQNVQLQSTLEGTSQKLAESEKRLKGKLDIFLDPIDYHGV